MILPMVTEDRWSPLSAVLGHEEDIMEHPDTTQVSEIIREFV